MKKILQRALVNWYQVSEKPLPRWLKRACDKDSELGKEKAFGEELTRALRKRPNDSGSSVGDNMAARVLNQISEEDYRAHQEESASGNWGVWLRSSGFAAAVLTMGLVMYQFLGTDVADSDSEAEVLVVNEDDATAGSSDEMAEDWQNPLDQEMDYIVADAKGAIGFLASSFIPSSYLEQSEEA